MRPSQAIIDLDALRANYRLAASLAPQSQTMAVVKANAYGHGAVAVARALEPLVPAFAVACSEEALDLRSAGIAKPILLLEGFFSQDEIALAAANNFWLLVENEHQVEALAKTALPTPLTAWLKIDTGMHRLGAPLSQGIRLYEQLRACGHIRQPIVIASHFACADELDNDCTARQIQRLKQFAHSISSTTTPPLSMANSPALLGWPESHGAWNRPGFMLYGSSPFADAHPAADQLQAVMSFQSQVISVRTVPCGETVGYGNTWRATRDSIIATVPVGYGDGYPRHAPSGTPVLVAGQMAMLAGRVSMDLITLDVTNLSGIAIGSPVELWGKNLPVNSVAAAAGTIGYELLTRMPGRLRRIYRAE